jgi:hypothetical protein
MAVALGKSDKYAASWQGGIGCAERAALAIRARYDNFLP